jgi:hypothetical protein
MVDKHNLQDISLERVEHLERQLNGINNQLGILGVASAETQFLSGRRELILGELACIRSIQKDLYAEHRYAS